MSICKAISKNSNFWNIQYLQNSYVQNSLIGPLYFKYMFYNNITSIVIYFQYIVHLCSFEMQMLYNKCYSLNFNISSRFLRLYLKRLCYCQTTLLIDTLEIIH